MHRFLWGNAMCHSYFDIPLNPYFKSKHQSLPTDLLYQEQVDLAVIILSESQLLMQIRHPQHETLWSFSFDSNFSNATSCIIQQGPKKEFNTTQWILGSIKATSIKVEIWTQKVDPRIFPKVPPHNSHSNVLSLSISKLS
jgi:hypothetical protein